MINEKQIEVLQWWYGTVDYQMGVMLLAKYGKNKVLLHTLMKPGKEKFGGMLKLQYELPKAVGLDYRKMPELPENVQVVEPPPVISKKVVKPAGANVKVVNDKKPDGKDSHFPYTSAQPLYQYPAIIRKIKHSYSLLYKERGVFHKKMVAVGEKNSPFNLKARAGLLAAIKIISKKMDFMYGFVVDYEKKGTVPLEEVVWPPAKKDKKIFLPEDLTELRKIKKNLQTSNTKYRNKLLYQQTSKKAKQSPLPPGPKRTKYELRIKYNEKQIVAIDNKIVELENVD